MLSKEMKMLVEFIKLEMAKISDIDDRHLETCQRTAERFDLWETTVKSKDAKTYEESFPLWLSYVVQGVGRDEGLLF